MSTAKTSKLLDEKGKTAVFLDFQIPCRGISVYVFVKSTSPLHEKGRVTIFKGKRVEKGQTIVAKPKWRL